MLAQSRLNSLGVAKVEGRCRETEQGEFDMIASEMVSGPGLDFTTDDVLFLHQEVRGWGEARRQG